MKSKLKNNVFKIIVCMMILLMISAISCNVFAAFNFEEDTWYTLTDISWDAENSHINLKQGDETKVFYCMNHGYNLTNGLGGDPEEHVDLGVLSLNWKETNPDYIYNLLLERYYADNAEIWQYKDGSNALRIESKGKTTIDTATNKTIVNGEEHETTRQERIEAAIYALSKYYGYSDNVIQYSLWKNLGQLENGDELDSKFDEAREIYRAFEYYADEWYSSDPTFDNTQLNLQYKSEDAQLLFDQNNSCYKAGPFNISYKSYAIDKIVFSNISNYTIRDEKNNEISGAKFINTKGEELASIPNGEDFYVQFPNNNDNKDIAEVNVNVELEYLTSLIATKEEFYTYMATFKYEWNSGAQVEERYYHSVDCRCENAGDYTGMDEVTQSCIGHKEAKYKYHPTGDLVADANSYEGDRAGKHGFYQDMVLIMDEEIEENGEKKNTTDVRFAKRELNLKAIRKDEPKEPEMEIAGNVWEDTPQGKDSKFNGYKDENDKILEGIEVRLYKVEENGAFTLATIKHSKNPTLTDKDGHYSFKGINPDYKYCVVFTYDGMIYTNTYGAGIATYNTQEWRVSSKGSELVNERDALNKKFVTISSYPLLYKTERIFDNGTYLPNGYNNMFRQDDEKLNMYKDKVKQQLLNYLSNHDRLEDKDYIKEIYLPIINSLSGNEKTEAMQILQYIWDCRINAYAGDESEQDGKTLRAGGKYYPYYDKFILEDDEGNRLFSDNGPVHNSTGHWYIYNGQLQINLGLIRRTTTDLELQQDLYKSIVSINGKDETYKYNTFSNKGMKINKDDAQIEQQISTGDYNYKVDAQTLSSVLGKEATYPKNADGTVYAPIEMYITYRINVKNNSSMPTSVNEIVSYIDSDYYSYSDRYVTTGGKEVKGVEGKFVYPNPQDLTEIVEGNLSDYDKESFGLKVNAHSKYGEASETGKSLGNDLYISFDKEVILEQNEMVSIYITYRLGENSTTNAKFNCTYKNSETGDNSARGILKDLANEKKYIYTRSEINAYSTFISKDNDVKTTQDKYNGYYSYKSLVQKDGSIAYRAAGVLDANSTPGNLSEEEVERWENGKGSKEDDWDRASMFVLVDSGKRSMKGNVWETEEIAHQLIGNDQYPEYKAEKGIKGITVELIEIKNGQEYVRARTETEDNGSYEFTNYIPGLYTVRFIYGDKVISNGNKVTLNGNEYDCVYNGQFYQSSKANPNTNNDKYWYAAEDSNVRYSDAYDEANIRNQVNTKLKEGYTYKDVVRALENPTEYMVYAYTSLLEIEVEKAKEESSSQKPSYTIENIDFALTPRTESKLSIKKEVSHLKLILQNGTVQFDVDTETIRNQGVGGVVQAAQYSDINVSMSSELVNGATLEITYKVTITNESEKDSVTYYKNSNGELVGLALYEEQPEKIVYYEDGNARTYKAENIGDNDYYRFQKQEDNTFVSYVEAGTTEMKEIDTSKTKTIETTTKAIEVADFISNNLNFIKKDYTGKDVNKDWDICEDDKDTIVNEYYKYNDENAIDSGEVYDSNVIVKANTGNQLLNELKAGEKREAEIVLSKVISVEDETSDNKAYNNKVRILKVGNTVSRIQEIEGTKTTEKVIISDPTGIGNIYQVIVIILVAVSIIAVGIILIKKFVIKNK